MELVVALPLLALLGVASVALLLHVSRAARAGRHRETARATLTAAHAALRTDVARTAPDGVLALTDTTLVLRVAIADGIVCAVHGGRVRLVHPSAPHPWSSGWRATPAAGDLARWPAREDDWLAPRRPAGSIASDSARVLATSPAASCAYGMPPGADAVELELAGTALPALGDRLLVERRIGWRLYVGAGGWMLGRRTGVGAAGFTATEPVAGPLRSPAQDGMRISRPDPALLEVRWRATARDSLRARLPLLGAP